MDVGRLLLAMSGGLALGCVAEQLAIAVSPASPPIAQDSWSMDWVAVYLVATVAFAAALTGALTLDWRLFLITGFCAGLAQAFLLSKLALSVWEGSDILAGIGGLALRLLGFSAATAMGYRHGRGLRWLQVRSRRHPSQSPPRREN